MKLEEIRSHKKPARKDSSDNTKNITIDSFKLGELKLKVTFDYEAGFSDRHGDDSSYDEKHEEKFTVTKIELAKAYEDEDGRKYEKGTDAEDIPGWGKKDEDLVDDELYGK